MDEPILIAKDLIADGSEGRIFGPIDVTLRPGQICVVSGPAGSGKSSLLLALCARFAPAKGSLELCGIDAMDDPYQALKHTSIARLGDYVGPEDRLTLEESILDRAYVDGISPSLAMERADLLAESVGVRFDGDAEFEDMPGLERVVTTVALAMLRPASIIALDDGDLGIRHRDLPLLYSTLSRLLAVDGAALVMSVTDDDHVPEDAVVIQLERNIDAAVIPREPLDAEHPELVDGSVRRWAQTAPAPGDQRRPGRHRRPGLPRHETPEPPSDGEPPTEDAGTAAPAPDPDPDTDTRPIPVQPSPSPRGHDAATRADS